MVELILYSVFLLLISFIFLILEKKFNLILIVPCNIFLLFIFHIYNFKVLIPFLIIFNIIYFDSITVKHLKPWILKFILFIFVFFILFFSSFFENHQYQKVSEFKNDYLLLSIIIAIFVFSFLIKSNARDGK